MKKKAPLSERVEAFKSSKALEYHELSLRDDLAQLIAVGMARNPNLTQRELTKLAGWKSESYVSRLANASTGFKIASAVRVLLPLGIEPMLVDKHEWISLKNAVESQLVESEKVEIARSGDNATTTTIDNATTTTIGTDRSGIRVQLRFEEPIGYSAGVGIINGTATEIGVAGQTRLANILGRPRAILDAPRSEQGTAVGYARVLSAHAGTSP